MLLYIIIVVLVVLNITTLLWSAYLVRNYVGRDVKSKTLFRQIARNSAVAINECASVSALPRTKGRNNMHKMAINRIRMHLNTIRSDAMYILDNDSGKVDENE